MRTSTHSKRAWKWSRVLLEMEVCRQQLGCRAGLSRAGGGRSDVAFLPWCGLTAAFQSHSHSVGVLSIMGPFASWEPKDSCVCCQRREQYSQCLASIMRRQKYLRRLCFWCLASARRKEVPWTGPCRVVPARSFCLSEAIGCSGSCFCPVTLTTSVCSTVRDSCGG